MTKKVFQKIIKEAQEKIKQLAMQNDWLWFYQMHQKEVVESAKDLLKLYPKADQKIVLISCWLHDIAHYYAQNSQEIIKVKEDHHIKSAQIAEKLLLKYALKAQEIEKIKNCILRHRNLEKYKPKTLEEKIMVVADTLSHFTSVFYLTYFKFHPDHSLETMIKFESEKLERDWRDLGLLPRAKSMVKEQYKILKNMLKNYGQNKIKTI